MPKKHICTCIIIALYLFSSGCAAFIVGAGAGTAGIIWYKGKMEETVEASVPQVHRAIMAGLKDLNIRITEDRADNLTAKVRAVMADGRKLSIDAESISVSSTKLKIRIGLLGEIGDKEFSLRIRDAIKKHL
jgi:hypothetical protein